PAEQDDLAGGGQVRDVPLEVPLGPFALGRLGERRDARDARVRVLRDPLDRPALAGRVTPLEDDDDPGSGLRDPVLHLHELFLQPAEFLLVGLLRKLAGTVLGVAMPAVLGSVPGSALALGLGRHRAPSAPAAPHVEASGLAWAGSMAARRSVALASLPFLLVACAGSGAPAQDARGDDAITVASFNFPESVLLAEIYSQAIEGAGVRVEREAALGPRELVMPALLEGLVEFVPEYSGSGLQFLAGEGSASPDRE